MDVLESPVPALVGVQAPFDPVQYAFDGVLVLDLDARQASVSVFRGVVSFFCFFFGEGGGSR